MKRRSATAMILTLSLLVMLLPAGNISPVIAQENGNAKDWLEDELLSSAEKLDRMKIPVKAKGIYLMGWSAGNQNFQKLLNLVNDTELNAMVIDMKEDEGRVTYQSGVPLVKAVKADGHSVFGAHDDLLFAIG